MVENNSNTADRIRCEYLETQDPYACYGCGACALSCPTDAIEMLEDKKGFTYPTLNEEKCINCGACGNICIYRKEQKQKFRHKLYAVQNKSTEVLEHCQSGGIFDAFSDAVIGDGGKVYGSIVCDNLSVKHIGSCHAYDRDKMRGSKYVRSELGIECIKKIGTDLGQGKSVLFTGTPCQCAAINALYGTYDNLFTVEFICHGTPSQNLYKDYIKWFEGKIGRKIKSVFFRIQAWKSEGLHTMLLEGDNEKQYFNSDYSALFYSHLGHRESCLKCGFANKNRQADITMGGFLDLNLFESFGNKYSVSMCILNSEKGHELFDRIKESVCIKEVDYDDNYFKQQPRLYHPVGVPNFYNEFWEEYMNNGYKSAVDQFVPQILYEQYHLVNPGGVISLQRYRNITSGADRVQRHHHPLPQAMMKNCA